VGECGGVEEALALVRQHPPELVLLDMEMPPASGIEVLRVLRQQRFTGKILVLSGHQEDDWVFRAMQAGASGYLLKTQLAVQLPLALPRVLDNEIYLPPELTTGFFRQFQHAMPPVTTVYLTEREQEVLQLLAQGDSNEQIAKALYISIATVKAHLTAIFEKLRVTSRTQAIIKAIRQGLVSA